MPERASVLLLVPAGVLLVIVLGAVAVDFAVAFAAERELADAAAAAANDAAVVAIDDERLYEHGEIALVADLALRAAEAAVAARAAGWLAPIEVVRVEVASGSPAVTVELRARARYVFARAVPGAPDGVTVQAAATASAVRR